MKHNACHKYARGTRPCRKWRAIFFKTTMDRQFKGIWIPAEIWEDTNLTWNEKVVLMEIDSFTAAGKDCFISDEYIGRLVGVSTRTASSIVSKLIRLGYVKKTRSDGRHRYLETAIIARQICNSCGADMQNLQTTYNKTTNTRINIKEEIHKEERFRKPTLQEVYHYCLERKNGIDPQTFLDFYDSKGWKVGNTPMKDWKAAIRTWESKRKNDPSPRSSAATPSPKEDKTYVPKYHYGPDLPKKENIVEHYRRVLNEINGTDNGRTTDTPDEQ